MLTRNRSRTLSTELARQLSKQILGATYPAGAKLPTESDLVEQFQVSRTVVREAISSLQAAGLVETRHGIGTFVRQQNAAYPFLIKPDQLNTLQDAVSLLELRIALESEAVALACARRSPENLDRLASALDQFDRAVRRGDDAAEADFAFHSELAIATQNPHFLRVFQSLGTSAIPRSRLERASGMTEERTAFLNRVNDEHRAVLSAVRAQDGDSGRAAIRLHLTNSRERLRKQLAANN
jgi:DNA-binding FadR family transcriptional regulator